MRPSNLLSLLGLLALGAGCASTPPPAPPAPPPPAAPADPLDGFGGPRHTGDASLRLKAAAVGFPQLGVIVQVVKAEWTEMDGEREATVAISVKRGAETKTVFMEEGDERTTLGVRLHVTATGEVYDEKTMRWPAFADLTVRRAL